MDLKFLIYKTTHWGFCDLSTTIIAISTYTYYIPQARQLESIIEFIMPQIYTLINLIGLMITFLQACIWNEDNESCHSLT